MDHSDFIATVPLFQDLQKDDLQRISHLCQEVALLRGAYLFQEGDTSDCAHVIKSGAVKVFRKIDNQETILDVLIDRDIIVDMSSWKLAGPRATNAQTVDRTVLLAIDRDKFVALLQTYHSVTLRLLEQLEQRIRDANAHIQNLAVLDSRNRVLRTLWWVFNKYRIEGPGDLRVAFRLTHRLLAGLSGTTRETVTRVLLELQDDHVLGFEGRSVSAIAYPEKLREMIAQPLRENEHSPSHPQRSGTKGT